MFCPACHDEFRPGFTRCVSCDVDLVASLADGQRSTASRSPAEPTADAPPAVVPMAEYCGFVALDDAREARERLRSEGIRSEIVIRDGPGSPGAGPGEEYWLRVDRQRLSQAHAMLGFDEATQESAAEDSSFQCGECGADVAAEESFCPKCGARFEEA